MKTADLQFDSRTEWLEARKNWIGCSDVPAMLGLSSFSSPLALYAQKTGIDEPDGEQTEFQEWGLRLEEPIGTAFGERTERMIRFPEPISVVKADGIPLAATLDATQSVNVCGCDLPDFFTVDDSDGLLMEPDRRPHTGSGVVQIKNVSQYKADEWKDGPPLYYQTQIQAELLCSDAAWGTLVALIGGNQLRFFDVQRDDEFCEALTEAVVHFWNRIAMKIPPDAIGSQIDSRLLGRLHPDDNGEAVDLPFEALELIEILDDAKARIKTSESKKRFAQNQLTQMIGDATFGILPNGDRLSWKTQERKATTIAASSFRVLRKLKSK